ncbi:MAG: hypothetical protein R3F14_17485 [Polyangiaceae bacterium]
MTSEGSPIPSEPPPPAPAPPESAAGETLIRVRDLKKTFRLGFFKSEVVEAVKGVSFGVHRGEDLRLPRPQRRRQDPTTIKMLTGLIEPTAGEAYLFGHRVPAVASREKLGFLPENPYVYPYLTPARSWR